MKINSVRIQNFRSYKEETIISFNELTAFVGQNDIGKSTILEALDIFFHEGKGLIKIDKEDINKSEKQLGNTDVVITVSFTDLPRTVLLDDTNETTLEAEYLLNVHNELQVKKIFKNASSPKILLIANHPTNNSCELLLHKKQNDLVKRIDELGLECEDRRKNAVMRKAIWNHFRDDLQLKEIELEVNSKDGDIKSIWEKLQQSLPYYSLFQSDRKNSDGDNEIQDPLKVAVKHILNSQDLQETLKGIAQHVQNALQQVSNLTLSKLQEMNPDVASSLHPKIDVESLKWADVFKNVSITGDEDIPINKRGSGIKRLVLINFFRAEAERRQKENKNSSIVYAIEEPETSQHKKHQDLLISALINLSRQANTQVIITTHSANVVKSLGHDNIRLVISDEHNYKEVRKVEKQILPSPSLNEINYLAFGDISEEFHNELYGYLQEKAIDESPNNSTEKDFDAWLQAKGCLQQKTWIRIKKDGTRSINNVTIQTYVRNHYHHPENTLNVKYTQTELEDSLQKMTEIAKCLL